MRELSKNDVFFMGYMTALAAVYVCLHLTGNLR